MASIAPLLHGLSRDVTLAVLPRLFTEELVAELTRRNISFGGYSFKQEILVGMLKDVMTQEYRNLEPGKYLSDNFSDDRNVEFMPDAELAERERFQGQILQKGSQTLSRICTAPNIENSPSTEAATQFYDVQDACTYGESQTKYESLCLEDCPDANGSCSSNLTSVSASKDHMKMGSSSEGMEIATSATTRSKTSELGDTATSKTELEDDKPHSDGELYSIDRGFQNINTGSISNEDNTVSQALGNFIRPCKDCEYGTNERSDFVENTRIHNISFVSGIKQEDEDHTSQSHLTETRQGEETPEVTTMVDPSNKVITDQHSCVQECLSMTEPVLQNSVHCNDEKAVLFGDGIGETSAYEALLDDNQIDYDESDAKVVNNGNKNSNGNDSNRCLEPKDILPFACKDCNYRTNRKQRLVRHTRIHTGEKPFMCSYCDFSTARREHLKSHMLRHSGEKPYKCRVCDFKTADHSYLVEHMRKHTGEKPYMCDECGYRTSYRSNIASHMKKHLV